MRTGRSFSRAADTHAAVDRVASSRVLAWAAVPKASAYLVEITRNGNGVYSATTPIPRIRILVRPLLVDSDDRDDAELMAVLGADGVAWPHRKAVMGFTGRGSILVEEQVDDGSFRATTSAPGLHPGRLGGAPPSGPWKCAGA